MSSHKIGFVSLGCPKALVDSERILTQLRLEGYAISPSYDDADMVIVNTCGFIDSARAESLDTIAEALNENGKVIVTGCMGVDEKLIRDEFPDILAVTGPQQYEAVMEAVHHHMPAILPSEPFTELVPPQGIKLTPRHYAYLKISEGCNHKCSFCIIPSLRGKLVSRPVGDVMGEAERLVQAGVKELLVISQDTSAYGVDLKYKMDFWGGKPLKTSFLSLSQALSELGVWVRLHYVYPYPHVDDVIPLMAEGKILPYLDIPFQHASPSLLKSMKRPAASENTLERIRQWREICPELVLRSTFIVGFPGETEEDFQYLLEWLEEAQIDRAGCFTYSPVEGARANDLPGQVDEETMNERWHRFMETQQMISIRKLQAKIGKRIEVLLDGYDEDGNGLARSKGDAPEIDGMVLVENPGESQPGDILTVDVIEAMDYDLVARRVE